MVNNRTLRDLRVDDRRDTRVHTNEQKRQYIKYGFALFTFQTVNAYRDLCSKHAKRRCSAARPMPRLHEFVCECNGVNSCNCFAVVEVTLLSNAKRIETRYRGRHGREFRCGKKKLTCYSARRSRDIITWLRAFGAEEFPPRTPRRPIEPIEFHGKTRACRIDRMEGLKSIVRIFGKYDRYYPTPLTVNVTRSYATGERDSPRSCSSQPPRNASEPRVCFSVYSIRAGRRVCICRLSAVLT